MHLNIDCIIIDMDIICNVLDFPLRIESVSGKIGARNDVIKTFIRFYVYEEIKHRRE